MSARNSATGQFIRLASIHRWLMPILMSLLGFVYTLWETILVDGYPLFSTPAVLGFFLLGVIGPVIIFFTLTWALRTAESYERAEREREHEYRQLVAMNTIGAALNQSLDLDTVLNRALDHVLQMLHLDAGEARLIQSDRLVIRACRGVSPGFVEAEKSIPLQECVCGTCAARGELLAVENVGDNVNYPLTNCKSENFGAILAMPVRTTERVVGVIHVASRMPRVFGATDRALLTAIGQQVGAAIERAQLHDRMKALNQQLEVRVADRTRELSVAKEEVARKADALRQILVEERRVEERTRSTIAHDLHDGIQQIIIGALFETQAARDALALNPELVSERLNAAQELLRKLEAEMRHTIYNLRPVALDVQGLAPAVRQCVASFETISRTRCELQIEGTPRRFNPDAEVAAFRIIQEALNNVEAHADAKLARVQVIFGTRELYISVSDNGRGFDTTAVMQEASTQLGLMGMQERAESVGGSLHISSRVGEGTRISLRIPLTQIVPLPVALSDWEQATLTD